MGDTRGPNMNDRLALSGLLLETGRDTHAKGNALARFSCQLLRYLATLLLRFELLKGHGFRNLIKGKTAAAF